MGEMRIIDWSTLRHRWRDAGLPVSLIEDKPIDNIATILSHKMVVDIPLIDDRLRVMHPGDGEDISMKEMIVKHYGETAAKFFEEAFL